MKTPRRQMRAFWVIAMLMGVAAWLATGCGRGPVLTTDLTTVETLADWDADSALRLLGAIDSASLPTGEPQATYTLLTALAKYKAGEKDTAVAPLLMALKTFHSEGNREREYMLGCYLLGVRRYERGEYSQAVATLMDAETEAERLKDRRYLGLSRRYIADSYAMVFCSSEQKAYALKSLDALKQYDDEEYLAWAYCDVARGYQVTGNNIEALIYADSAKMIADRLNNEIVTSDIELAKAHNYRILNNNAEALRHWASAIETPNNIVGYFDIVHIIIAMETAADSISVSEKKRLTDFIEQYGRGGINVAEYYANRGDYKRAYEIASAHSDSAWRRFGVASSADISLIVNNKREQQLQVLHERDQRNHELIIALICIFLTGTALLSYFFRQRSAIAKMRNENLLTKIAALTEDINAMRENLDSMDENNTMMMSKGFSTINSLLEASLKQSGTSRDRYILKEATDAIRNIGSKSTLHDFATIVNRNNKNAVENIGKIANITEEEIQLFIYIRMGFSSSALSALMATSVENIYRKKYKLKGKIKKSGIEDADYLVALIGK